MRRLGKFTFKSAPMLIHYSGVTEAHGVVQKKSDFFGVAFGLRLPVQRERCGLNTGKFTL